MKEIVVGVIQYREKILILKRHEKKEYDPNRWEFVSGFIRGKEDFAGQALEQVEYETGLRPTLVREGESFEVIDEYGKWLIHPFLFSSDSDNVHIRPKDHSEYRWININELSKFECVKDLDKNLIALGIFI